MAATATATVLKMLKGASNRKTFEDFPEWVAACEKLRGIGDDYNEAMARLSVVNNSLLKTRLRSAAVDAAVAARLGNATPQSRVLLEEDIEQIELNLRVLRNAMAQQSEIVQEIESRCAAEIMREARPTHEQLIRNTRAALIALADAMDAESEFTRGLARDRVSVASLAAIPHRIRQAVGSRSHWSSGVNEADRTVSAYLGEKWDHSRVTA